MKQKTLKEKMEKLEIILLNILKTIACEKILQRHMAEPKQICEGSN